MNVVKSRGAAQLPTGEYIIDGPNRMLIFMQKLR